LRVFPVLNHTCISYAVLGKSRIHSLVNTFYTLVFADTPNPWFRDAFARLGDLEHHVATQSAFWEDVMGGGRRYHGGEYRLHFHHTNNAAAVMTAKGATRWMFHMRHALQTHAAQLTRCDPRVVPCILQVLILVLFGVSG
jgi:truncated hemoglobin YjbI